MHDHQIASDHKVRQDNKVRLSQDVLEKADRIAAEWGLKNARAAVEAVFRRYCDDYLYGHSPQAGSSGLVQESAPFSYGRVAPGRSSCTPSVSPQCEALDALDQLLAL